MDQMIGNYTTKRQTRRWPVAVLYNIMDLAALNAYFMYTHENKNFRDGKTNKRRMFIKDIATELVLQLMRRRAQNPKLPNTVRSSMKLFITLSEEENILSGSVLKKKRRCSQCPTRIGRMSTLTCTKCNKSTCNEYTVLVCIICLI